jgi:hypothetical protein
MHETVLSSILALNTRSSLRAAPGSRLFKDCRSSRAGGGRTPKAIICPAVPRPFMRKKRRASSELFTLGIPILGICYGVNHHLHARRQSRKAAAAEYGSAVIDVTNGRELFEGIGAHTDVWMSHGDALTAPPPGFEAWQNTEFRSPDGEHWKDLWRAIIRKSLTRPKAARFCAISSDRRLQRRLAHSGFRRSDQIHPQKRRNDRVILGLRRRRFIRCGGADPSGYRRKAAVRGNGLCRKRIAPWKQFKGISKSAVVRGRRNVS